MSLIDKDTDNLMNILKAADPIQVKEYMSEQFKEGEPQFSRYMDDILASKNLKRQDVLIKANLPQKYGYKLLTGESHTTDRDKILRICFSAQMTLKETQRALKLYGMNELYPKIKRDVVLIVALSQRVFDIDKVNELLMAEGEAPLYDMHNE